MWIRLLLISNQEIYVFFIYFANQNQLLEDHLVCLSIQCEIQNNILNKKCNYVKVSNYIT